MLFIFRLIANGLAPLTLIGAIAAYLHPPLFLIFKQSFLWFFAATMFALGLVLKSEDMSDTLKHPTRIGLGVLTQYSVMPLLGFAVAFFTDLPREIALGFIIVGCAPGAMASNVIVYLAGGALAFSIALTTVATFLSPLVTPSLVELLGGVFMPIPFWGMMKTILQTVLIPLIAGMVLRHFMNDMLKKMAGDIAPAVAAIAIIIICSYAVAANQERIATMGTEILLLVVLLNALGYLAGWFAAKWFKYDHKHQLTLAIEIGMQNAGLGVALALKHFTPETALPGALFAVWCILTSAGATSFFRYKHRGLSISHP